jgi:hypothetical protein
MMVELLSPVTKLPVFEAREGMQLEPGHVYINPPGPPSDRTCCPTEYHRTGCGPYPWQHRCRTESLGRHQLRTRSAVSHTSLA